MMMESWKITMVAYMLEKALLYHSIDEDGNLKYDERKTSGFTLLMQGFR
jgi:hypothetical protein